MENRKIIEVEGLNPIIFATPNEANQLYINQIYAEVNQQRANLIEIRNRTASVVKEKLRQLEVDQDNMELLLMVQILEAEIDSIKLSQTSQSIDKAMRIEREAIDKILTLNTLTSNLVQLEKHYKNVMQLQTNDPEFNRKIERFQKHANSFKEDVKATIADLTFGQHLFVTLCAVLVSWMGGIIGSIGHIPGLIAGSVAGFVAGGAVGRVLVSKCSMFKTVQQNAVEELTNKLMSTIPTPKV